MCRDQGLCDFCRIVSYPDTVCHTHLKARVMSCNMLNWIYVPVRLPVSMLRCHVRMLAAISVPRLRDGVGLFPHYSDPH